MKCIHRKEISVAVSLNSNICWDDGIHRYDSIGRDIMDDPYYSYSGEGNPQPEQAYLEIIGCDKCKVIKVRFD